MRGNFDNLPKWAKQEIARLERDVEHYKETLRVGPEDSNTFANPYSGAPTPLGKDTIILFQAPAGDIRVRLDERGRLEIHGGSGIAIHPRATNTVSIQVTQP